jgi:hypothetical protein
LQRQNLGAGARITGELASVAAGYHRATIDQCDNAHRHVVVVECISGPFQARPMAAASVRGVREGG